MAKNNSPQNPEDGGLYSFDWDLEPESSDWWKPGYKDKEEQYKKWEYSPPPKSRMNNGVLYDENGEEVPFSHCCGMEFFDEDGETGRWSDHICWHIKKEWRDLTKKEHQGWVKFCKNRLQNLIKPFKLYDKAYWNAIIDFSLDPPIRLRTVRQAINRGLLSPKAILNERLQEQKERRKIVKAWRVLTPAEMNIWNEFDKRIFIETRSDLTKADKKNVLLHGTGYDKPGYYLFKLFWEERHKRIFNRHKDRKGREPVIGETPFRTPYQAYKLGLLKRCFPESVAWSHSFWNWLLES